MKPTRTVKTADTLLSVINTLQELDGAGVTELAEHLGLAKSTAHDHLATLRKHGYVRKDGDTYFLSLRFLDHGTYARDRLSERATIAPPLGRLAADTDETVWFSVEENGELVYLFRAVGERGVDLICRPGTRVPLHTTAAGKAILARYPDERVREIAADRKLTRRTQRTVTDIDVLLAELDEIRDAEVATTRGEDHDGVASVAAVVAPSGRPVGAVSVSGPERRFAGETLDDVERLLFETVDEIELRLSNDVCG